MADIREELRAAIDESMLKHTGRSIGDLASQQVVDDIWPLIEAREKEWDSKEQALQKAIAEHQRVIAKLEAREAALTQETQEGAQQCLRTHRILSEKQARLVDALEVARMVAEAPIEIAKFGASNKTQMRVLCLRSDVRRVQEQAMACLLNSAQAGRWEGE